MGVKSLMAAILCAGLIGCAQKFKPEPALPTPEQLAALLNAPAPHPDKPYTPEFKLTLYPRIVLAGQATYLTCYVPEGLDASFIAYGMDGLQSSSGPVEKVENKILVQHIPCGTWTAYCKIATPTGDKSLKETLEVAGCDGDNRDK